MTAAELNQPILYNRTVVITLPDQIQYTSSNVNVIQDYVRTSALNISSKDIWLTGWSLRFLLLKITVRGKPKTGLFCSLGRRLDNNSTVRGVEPR